MAPLACRWVCQCKIHTHPPTHTHTRTQARFEMPAKENCHSPVSFNGTTLKECTTTPSPHTPAAPHLTVHCTMLKDPAASSPDHHCPNSYSPYAACNYQNPTPHSPTADSSPHKPHDSTTRASLVPSLHLPPHVGPGTGTVLQSLVSVAVAPGGCCVT